MSEGKRPGGLTALAVMNFLGGAYDLLSVCGLGFTWALINFPEFAAKVPMDEKAKRSLEVMRELGNGPLCALIAVHAVLAVLLIAAGVGYLKQKRFLGRTLGNVYAVVSLVATLVMVFAIGHKEAGGSFELITIILLLYPVLTLVLLNTTFKEDLAN